MKGLDQVEAEKSGQGLESRPCGTISPFQIKIEDPDG